MSGTAAHFLPPGAARGAYRVERVISAGVRGARYNAVHLKSGHSATLVECLPRAFAARPVGGDGRMLDRIAPLNGTDEAAMNAEIARFLDGVRAVRGLNSPYWTPVIDRFETGGAAYAVLRSRNRPNLANAASGRRVGAEDIATVLSGLAEGLACLHEAGWRLPSLSPDCVWLVGDRPEIDDVLGLTRASGAIGSRPQTRAGVNGASATHPVCGAPGYVAPERLLPPGSPPMQDFGDARADLYALAAIGLFLHKGTRPPPAAARLRSDPAPMLLRGLPDGLATLLERTFSLHPDDRPACARDFLKHLRNPRISARASTVEKPVAPEPPPVKSPTAGAGAAHRDQATRTPVPIRRPTRRAAFLAAGAAAIASGLAIVGYIAYLPSMDRIRTEWIVDSSGAGHAETIGEAIRRASEGSVIKVRAGVYRENLIIDKRIDLRGAGTGAEDVRIDAESDRPCLALNVDGVRVAGIWARTIDETPDAGAPPCILATAGRHRIEDVTVGPTEGDGVVVQQGAEAEIVATRIRAAGGAGIRVESGGAATISQSEISLTAASGLIVRGQVQMKGTLVGDAGQAGVLILPGSIVDLSDNVISGQQHSGVEVRGGAPTLTGNRIRSGAEAGLYLTDGAGGVYKDNVLNGNAGSGAVLYRVGAPRLSGNRFSDNGEHGVFIVGFGRANVDSNAIYGNAGLGVLIDTTGRPRVTDNRVEGNRDPQSLTAPVIVTE